ncbi:MAG: TIGR00159 family protein [Clostridiales bacterium]|nr:TIGR00159 family protein [Clostridiales bacterium]
MDWAKFGVGISISMALLMAMVIVFIWFFIRKKAIKLTVFYITVTLFTAGLFILSLFYPGLEIALFIMTVVVIGMVVAALLVYQNDLKVLFSRLTSTHRKSEATVFSDEELQLSIEEIVKATQSMSKSRTGALIVIAPHQISSHILESGITLNSLVAAPMLESIFQPGAPMHDGAVVIKGNKILAAGCFLPLSQSQSIAKDLGTRHRAAIGITEETDNISIVVSEETGIISVSLKGVLRRYITPERLSDILYEAFGVTIMASRSTGLRRFF